MSEDTRDDAWLRTEMGASTESAITVVGRDLASELMGKVSLHPLVSGEIEAEQVDRVVADDLGDDRRVDIGEQSLRHLAAVRPRAVGVWVVSLERDLVDADRVDRGEPRFVVEEASVQNDVRTVGTVYGIPPQPHVPEHTTVFPAGVVTFGVEYRDLDPESSRATYAGDADQLAELEERSPDGGFSDQGVTIHVRDAADGHLHVRFDCFDDEPHYHYNHRVGAGGEVINNVVDFDVAAHGAMLPWAIACVRTRLPEMLEHAGAGDLAARLDPDVVGRAIDDVERRATDLAGSAAR